MSSPSRPSGLARGAAAPGAAGRSRPALTALLRVYHEHDPGGAAHGAFVCRVAVGIARRLGLEREVVAAVAMGAVLHDVGKLAVPRELLLKAAPLSREEWGLVRAHPRYGHGYVRAMVAHPDVLAAVRSHHERVDGQGYPDRLAGPRIPPAARIVAVADAYAAMIERRPYAPARPSAAALRELERCAGTQFDERCVEVLRAVAPSLGPAVGAAAA